MSLLFSILAAVVMDSAAVDSLSLIDSLSLDSLNNGSLTLDSVSIDSLAADTLVADTTFFDAMLADVSVESCDNVTPQPELTDSAYKARLQALPFVIETPYNQVIRQFILRYVKHNPQQLARLQGRSEYYFPLFTDILAKYDMPYEICYLAVIESALNPQAKSHMGAAGLWQFMPSTGRLYGLEINSLIDERMDPIKSTDAACRFLKTLYTNFGDWNLAIAAYNCGPGNVNKAIHRAGGKRDFWSIYPYLPRETRGYLPIYIAASYAMNYADYHGICPEPIELTLETDTIVTSIRLHLKQIADVLDVDIEELRLMNPQYGRDIVPGGKPYTIKLPADKTTAFIDQQDSIHNYMAKELILNRRAEIDMWQKTSVNGLAANGIYKVKNGDTLGCIAKRFHCSVKQLKAWNGLKSDNIRVGQKLKVRR